MVDKEEDLYASLERYTTKDVEGSMKTDHIVVNMGRITRPRMAYCGGRHFGWRDHYRT